MFGIRRIFQPLQKPIQRHLFNATDAPVNVHNTYNVPVTLIAVLTVNATETLALFSVPS